MPEHWYAMTCRPQKERAACALAERLGHIAYVPMRSKVVQVSGKAKRTVVREFPIVSGFVFVAIEHRVEPEDVYRMVRPGTKVESPFTGIIGNGVDPIEIPYDQIARMVRVNADVDALDIARARGEIPAFEPSTRVRVQVGALEGFEGVVQQATGYRAKVLIQLLGRETIAELPVTALAAG